jgi:hypothetical protein
MSTNTGYRQTRINFSRTTGPLSNAEMPSNSTTNGETNPQGLMAPASQQIPTILMKEITRLAHKHATVFCSINNLSENITNLSQNKNDGTIPPSLESKFTKLFNAPSEASVRSMVIASSIDAMITNKKAKLDELEATYNSRYEELRTSLDAPLQTCQLTIPPEQILPIFDTKIRDFKLQFILKQRNDNLKKEQKREKFLLRQEEQNEVVTLSVKQLSALKNDIASLTSQIKSMKLSPKKAKSKNAKAKEQLKNPKSIGNTKGKSGKKKSTSRNK